MNRIYNYFDNNERLVHTKLINSPNKKLIRDFITSEISLKDSDNIENNFKKYTDKLTKETQSKILMTLVYLKDYKINDINTFDVYHKGLRKGKRVGYKSGYSDAKSNQPNKYHTDKSLKEATKLSDELFSSTGENTDTVKETKEAKTTIQKKIPTEIPQQLTSKNIKPLLLGNYNTLEEAENDCNYTSQTRAYINLLQGKNTFLTGPAGSGKSFVINRYTALLERQHRNIKIARTSTTGISATNINGRTIHSFLGINFTDFNYDYYEVKKRYQKMPNDKMRLLGGLKRIRESNIIIIDEISMMSERFFNFFADMYKDSNSKAQIIVCGDFSQLPPVAPKSKIEEFGESVGNFCFESRGWNSFNFSICYLDKIFRAKDKKLSHILDEISLGRGVSKDVVGSLLTLSQTKDKFLKGSALLLSTNTDTDKINKREQEKNKNKLYTYTPLTRPDLVNEPDFSEEDKAKICQHYMIKERKEKPVSLKPEDTVMVTSNLYATDFYNIDYDEDDENPLLLANGTIATFIVDEYKGRTIFGVRYNGEEFYIKPKLFSDEYVVEVLPETDDYNEDEIKYERIVRAAYQTIPLKLAYAITIHKSQGQSFSNVTCDLTKSFMAGLGYVALSRATDFNGITLLNENGLKYPFNKKSLEINPESLVIKKKTQALAKEQRDNSSIEELKDVLNSPFTYMNELIERTLTPAQLKEKNNRRKRGRRY